MTIIDRRGFLAATTATSALAAVPALAQADQSQALNAYLDAQYEEEILDDPEELTSQGRKQKYDQLTDRSEAHAERQLAWRRKSVAGMKAKFDPAKLNEEARTSYDMWALELDRAERRAQFRRQRYVFARGGVHTGLPNFLINFHRVDDKSDMEAYVARVGKISVAMDQSLARAKLAAADGIRMPRWEYDRALSEVTRVTTGAPFTAGPDSALYGDARRKIDALKTAGKISPAEADALLARTAQAMTGQMKPAYERLTAWLTADKPNTSAEAKGAG